MQKRRRIAIYALVVLAGLVCLFVWPGPQVPWPRLVSPTEMALTCGNQRMAGEVYDLSLEGRDIATPEADLSLRALIDKEGEPDGYLSEKAFAARECYFLTFFWFGKGLSARTRFLPIVDKMTSEVKILSLEHFQPTGDISSYAALMGMDEAALSASYHRWVDIESIVYP